MNTRVYRFRWYGETQPVARDATETRRLFQPLAEQASLSDSSRLRLESAREAMGGVPGRVLDFGCSFGIFSLHLAREGHDVVALDLDEDAIAIARDFFPHPRVQHLCQDLFLSDLAPGSFDCIFFSNAIEHLYCVDRFVARFRELLAPGGALLCSTPNAVSLGDCVDMCLSLFDRDGRRLARAVAAEAHLPDLDHVAAYTRPTLIRLFDRLGFEVETCRVTGWSSLPLPLGRLRAPGWLRRLPPLRAFGDELLLVARKPGPARAR